MAEVTGASRWREARQIAPKSIRSPHAKLRSALAGAAVAVMATGLLLGAFWYRSVPPVPPAAFAPQSSKVFMLHCQFYVFVENRPFVAFAMEREPGEPARYRQDYVAKADGDRTDYNALLDRRPEWRLDTRHDPQRLEATVVVPNSSQAGVGDEEIAIELREFDDARADGVWREASLKSVYYQNLPGKCRQATAPAADQRADD